MKTKKAFIVGVLMVSLAFASCDSGKIDTVISVESLTKYMDTHPNFQLFLHNIPNFRSPMYVCAYGPDEERITPAPLGKHGSTVGLEYGNITAVDLPWEEIKSESGDPRGQIVFVRNGQAECPISINEESDDNIILAVGAETISEIFAPSGYLSSLKGGEEWFICGSAGNESCEPQAGIGFSGTSMNPNSAPSGEIVINAHSMTLNIFEGDQTWTNFTICWDPDLDGPESSIVIHQLPIPYEEPWGWPAFAPIEGGIFHLHQGLINCADADFSSAMAAVEMPFDATFGPAGSQIAYPANSSGSLLVIGAQSDAIPVEAQPRIIPLVNWQE